MVVSGGSINSPQLLLLSGIGPEEHLRSVRIRPVVNLPGVGENLHNHQSYGLDFNINHSIINELTTNTADQYLQNQTGPMSSTGLAQLTGILASSFTTKDDPDTQIFFAGYQATCDTGTRIPDLVPFNKKETIRFTSVNVQPRSRGKWIHEYISKYIIHTIKVRNVSANISDKVAILFSSVLWQFKVIKSFYFEVYNFF